MVFTTERLLEVTIKSWPGWDLNPRTVKFIGRLSATRLTYQAMTSTCTQSQLCTATPTSSFAQCKILFRLLSLSVVTFGRGSHMSIV